MGEKGEIPEASSGWFSEEDKYLIQMLFPKSSKRIIPFLLSSTTPKINFD